MDAAIALNDRDVAELFEDLGPAPDATNRGVAVSSQTRLGDVETWPSPTIGDKNQPEPVRAGFEGWSVWVFPSEYAVGNFGVGFNLRSGSRHGRNSGSFGFGSHGASFPPAAHFFLRRIATLTVPALGNYNELDIGSSLVAGAANTRSRKTGQPQKRGLAFFVAGPIEVPAWEQAKAIVSPAVLIDQWREQQIRTCTSLPLPCPPCRSVGCDPSVPAVGGAHRGVGP